MNSMEDLFSTPDDTESGFTGQRGITRVLFDQSMTAIIVAGHDGAVQSANETAARILGYDWPSQLPGIKLSEIDAGNTDQWYIQQVESFDSGKSSRAEGTSRFRKQDGSLTWVRFRLTFIPGDNEKAVHLVLFFCAHNTEKEFEEKLADSAKWLEAEVGLKTLELHETNLELTAALKKLETLDRTKNEFLQIISHEIRTPLNGMVGSVMMLKELATTTEQAEFFELLEISIQRLQGFAMTAMHIAQLQTLGKNLPRQPVLLVEILDEIRTNIDFARHRRNFTIATPPGLAPLMIDKSLFISALTKILENSVRFTPVDGIISLRVNPESDGLHFSITDNGPGFPEDVILHKFEPFVSGNTHVDQNPAMSLSLVKFIIEAHGGKIDIRNQISGGAVVDFYIPEH